MSEFDSQVSEPISSDGDYVEQEDEDEQDDYYGGSEDFVDDCLQQSLDADPEWYSYKCLDHKELWCILYDQVTALSSKHGLDFSSTLALLQCCSWNSDSLAQRLQENRLKILTEAHVLPSQDKTTLQVESTISQTCLVCFSPSTVKSISCRHCFCEECWLTYLTVQVKDGKSLGIECMMCDTLVTMETAEEFLKPLDDIRNRYAYLKITDIVLAHRLLRWCPGVDCNMVFLVEEALPKRVTCSKCNISLCFLCGVEYHSPAECELFKNWLIKCQDDSETFNYISANTKDCPKCHTSIEKNGGCNHINCSRCSHDFCWMCLEEWSKHCGEYYECSRYKSDPSKYEDKASKERCALQKYLFYFERWKNHHQSLLLEDKTRATIQHHIEKKVSENEGTWIDWQYLQDAASLLKKCRYSLKYTYPRAYWMEGDRKDLFEYQQAQLELEIENLSWKVERASITDRADLEQQMLVTEIRRTTLMRDFVA